MQCKIEPLAQFSYVSNPQAQQEEQAEEAKARELEKQLAFLDSEPPLDGLSVR